MVSTLCMKTIFSAAVILGMMGIAHAADTPVWQENFEKSVPGDAVKGWNKSWGEQGDDAFVVSNEVAASGEKSLLFDRTTGTNTKMWGFSTRLPDIQKDWAVFSTCLYIQGAGNDANLSFEIRDIKSRAESLASFSFLNKKFTFFSGDRKSRVDLGEYKPQTWYRVTLWMPTKEGDQKQAYAKLEESDGKGGWQAGTLQSVPGVAPENGYGILMLVVPKDKRNFRVFMDDFQLASQPESERK